METTAKLRLIFLFCSLIATVPAAQAQARYTFVSMTGHDTNNCISARTACRTVQRAHDVVDEGGAVVIRDSGEYGAVVITKSVTISGEGVQANLTGAGPQSLAVTINTTGVRVKLRYLSILGFSGVGVSSRGIGFLNGGALHVEHCIIRGFSIGLQMDTLGPLYISDSVIRENRDTGLFINVGTFPTAKVAIERTRLDQNGNALRVFGGVMTIRHSSITGNGNGIFGAGMEMTVDDCNISHNDAGIFIGFDAVVRVANSTIANNTTGLIATGDGRILSRVPASNTLVSNISGGFFTGTYEAQ